MAAQPGCVFIANCANNSHLRLPILKSLILRLCGMLGRRGATISVAIVSDAEIRKLNGRFLRHSYATDVLAFPMNMGPGIRWGERKFLGEVIVSADRARQRAEEFGVTFQEELMRYICHGVLHLVGFRDKTASQRNRMRLQENRLLRLLGPQVARII